MGARESRLKPNTSVAQCTLRVQWLAHQVLQPLVSNKDLQ